VILIPAPEAIEMRDAPSIRAIALFCFCYDRSKNRNLLLAQEGQKGKVVNHRPRGSGLELGMSISGIRTGEERPR
jgi:hypothetical protein